MPLPPPSALLFDLDGVLVRSEEVWFRVVEEAGRRFRGRPVTREEFTPTFGQGTEADVSVFGLRCTPGELNRFYAESFMRHTGALWINPEAATLLAELEARGKQLALVTNTVSPLARDILAAAGLASHFRVLACADLVPRAKPAPDLLRYALERLGRAPEEAWMVGDSRYDREAARAAGVFFIGLGLDGDLRIDRLGQLSAFVP